MLHHKVLFLTDLQLDLLAGGPVVIEREEPVAGLHVVLGLPGEAARAPHLPARPAQPHQHVPDVIVGQARDRVPSGVQSCVSRLVQALVVLSQPHLLRIPAGYRMRTECRRTQAAGTGSSSSCRPGWCGRACCRGEAAGSWKGGEEGRLPRPAPPRPTPTPGAGRPSWGRRREWRLKQCGDITFS